MWRYLTEIRCLPETILKAAAAADAVREGPYASAWFAHRDHGGALTGFEMRGPEFRGFAEDGGKTLFRFGGGTGPFARVALAALAPKPRREIVFGGTQPADGRRAVRRTGRSEGRFRCLIAQISMFCTA